MRRHNATSLPLWKWILELIIGAILFSAIYGFGWVLPGIPQPAVKYAAIIIAALFFLALFLLWTRLFEKRWHWDLIGRNVGKHLLGGISIGVAYFIAVTAILFAAGCYSARYASPHWDYILLNLCFYFFVACGEEVIFRGIIFRLIDDRLGIWWALGISALIFGFAHITNPGASIWSSVAIAIEAGVLLGAAYKYANSLWLPIGIHWAWNFTQGNVFGFAVSGGNTEESILSATLSGPDIITGAGFGPEASIIALALGLALSAFFIWRILVARNTE